MKRICFVLFLFILLVSSPVLALTEAIKAAVGANGAAAPSGPYTDNFNRASLGTNWTTLAGANALTIVSSSYAKGLTISAWNLIRWSANSFANNQYAKCKVSNISVADAGPIVRAQSGGTTPNCYWLDVNSQHVKLKVIVNGSATTLYDHTRNNADGDVWTLSISGSTMTVNVNGADLFTKDDATFSSGSAGLGGWSNVTYLDDWEGGNL